MARCSLGRDDVSGRAEEKFHSSSSAAGCAGGACDVGAGTGEAAGLGVLKKANGSEAGCCCCCCCCGWGVADCDVEGEAKEENWERALLLLLGVRVPLALLSLVMEERRAGPGMSETVSGEPCIVWEWLTLVGAKSERDVASLAIGCGIPSKIQAEEVVFNATRLRSALASTIATVSLSGVGVKVNERQFASSTTRATASLAGANVGHLRWRWSSCRHFRCAFHIALLHQLVSLDGSVYAIINLEKLRDSLVVVGLFLAHLLDLGLSARQRRCKLAKNISVNHFILRLESL